MYLLKIKIYIKIIDYYNVMKTLFVIFLCFFKQASSKLTEPSGKYCGEIISNPIDIIFNMNLHLANISASIFQKDYVYTSYQQYHLFQTHNYSSILYLLNFEGFLHK